MANMASVSYAIEGPEESLKKIEEALVKAVHSNNNKYDLYQAAEYLGLPDIKEARLGGELSDVPGWDKKHSTLRFSSEERWGLQDFAELLEEKFPDISIYWVMEEPGMDLYFTNDKKGKYFPERYWVDTAQDDIYQSEYFCTEEDMYEWLNEKYGVKSEEEVEAWNADYEATGDDCENFIYIHKFEVE